MSGRNLIFVIVAIVIVVVLGWYYVNSQKQVTPESLDQTTSTTEPTPPADNELSSPSAEVSSQSTVKISASGFAPQAITIKAGETVTWMNDDSATHNVSSAPHPTHTDYPPLNLGAIQPGTSKSLMFPKAGTYKYHDHLNPTLTGSITVQ